MKRDAVDVEFLVERRLIDQGPDRPEAKWLELRTVKLDGQEYNIPADAPVRVETTSSGPQLVTVTFWASDVRYAERYVAPPDPGPSA